MNPCEDRNQISLGAGYSHIKSVTPLRLIGWVLVLILASGISFAAHPEITIYAGGVSGVSALADPEVSVKYRREGGGMYLHNNGWDLLTPQQQQTALSNFENLPIAIELGFIPAEAWAERLRTGYLTFGIEPVFIASNAFASGNKPTPEEWGAYIKALRGAGLPDSTRVLPTFEFANFGGNIPTLLDNTVSKREDFQSIIRLAGGIVLDAPPGYAFEREEGYRLWMIDAIRWTREQDLMVVWITSPFFFHDTYRSDTVKFLRFMLEHDALPTDIVCENYSMDPPETYPNVVGDEDEPNTPLGVAYLLQHTVVPMIQARDEQDQNEALIDEPES